MPNALANIWNAIQDPDYYRALNERLAGVVAPVEGFNQFAGALSGTIPPEEFGRLRLNQLAQQLQPTPENAMQFMSRGITRGVKPGAPKRRFSTANTTNDDLE